MTHTPNPRVGGFSLLELMIALALVALLLGFAIPGYQQYMQRSRRSDALDALYQLQQAQVRYRGFHDGYAAALADLKTPFVNNRSAQGYYQLETGAPAGEQAYSFFVRARAIAKGAQSGDADCQTLTLTQRRQTVTLEPLACWGRR
ncbi:type IV pilin protein [Chromobacterium alticapitis]|uniref:Pilus assembly protein PilE n=1 Tax=Chromobacterium alticapitis TaxID=2073169 RepID=A0A2S5DDB6_9NEIS|nr:type IV pilin protein [Chromobacterium alticapitis]POZ61076.1 pilus assembly protein PilE [Chromobacterium alticapitis]